MDQEKLEILLKLHQKWLINKDKGRRLILYNADLRGVNLCGANLRYAGLCGADLSNASLYGAIIRDADLCDADLSYADLRDADLRGTYLCGTNLQSTRGLSEFMICPEGSITGYKKTYEGYILKLEIPKSAKRCNKIGSRKCRTNKAKILGAYNPKGIYSTKFTTLHSFWNPDFIYKPGQLLKVPNFCDDVRLECAPGIHFFLTYEEADDFIV